jgi:hypothetical protein
MGRGIENEWWNESHFEFGILSQEKELDVIKVRVWFQMPNLKSNDVRNCWNLVLIVA